MGNEWRISARAMLSRGYGVEDISITLGIPIEEVRLFVSALRKSGRLTEVLFGHRYRGAL